MTVSVTFINISNCEGDVVELKQNNGHSTTLQRGESARWGFHLDGGTVDIQGSHTDGKYLGDVEVTVKKMEMKNV